MMPRRIVCKPSVVGVARAGVVSVPPIGASGIQSLAIQPRAPTIAIPVAIVAGPPADSDRNKAMIEVAVPADEVLVIAVTPSIVAAMPLRGPIIPSILATAAVADMLTTIPTPTGIMTPAAYTANVSTTTPTRVVVTATTPSEVASMPAAAAKVATSSAHATEVATSATASHATTTVAAATVADQCNVTVGRAEHTL
jgi:hypothetical protein